MVEINTLLRRIFIVFLLVVIAGSVLFCMLAGMALTSGKMHHAFLDHGTLATHLGYIKILTSGVVTTSLVLTIFLLMAVTTLAYLHAPNLSAHLTPARYTGQGYHNVTPDIQLTIRHWLSLFGRSPAS